MRATPPPSPSLPQRGRSQGVLLSGWYGGGNVGDEAVLAALVQLLRDHDPDLPITALSVNPEQTARLHKIKAIRRNPLRFCAALADCDSFALGGGGTVQDVTSVWNLPSYLLYPMLARRMGKRVVWCGVGIGPLRTRLGRWLAARAARAAQRITVRDEASAQLLRNIGVPTKRVAVTADPALALRPIDRAAAMKVLQSSGVYDADGALTGPHLTPPPSGEVGRGFERSDTHPPPAPPDERGTAAQSNRPLVVFALRRPLDPQLGKRLRPGYLLPVSVRERFGAWSAQAEQLYQETVEALAQLADYCVSEWQAETLFVPFDAVDRKVAAAVRRRMRYAERSHELVGEHHPAMVMGIVGLADLVVAMRLHGLILGAAMGRPLLALSYDRKVSSFMAQLGAGEWTLPVTDAAALVAKAAQLWPQREAVAQQIAARAEELKRKARLNANIIEAGAG
jgi:polysaccharide pyruvyl transferase WcaK-like protein